MDSMGATPTTLTTFLLSKKGLATQATRVFTRGHN
jgi:hypothetical protein